MTVFWCLVFFCIGFATAYYQARTRRPRHQHYWEIVEKKELPSAVETSGLSDVGRLMTEIASHSYEYMPNTDSVLRLARKEVLVHSRCPCGAEKVERV